MFATILSLLKTFSFFDNLLKWFKEYSLKEQGRKEERTRAALEQYEKNEKDAKIVADIERNADSKPVRKYLRKNNNRG